MLALGADGYIFLESALRLSEGTKMQTDQSTSCALTPAERRLAVAIGLGMLLFSLVSLAVMVALFLPLLTVVEGLSK